MRLHAGASLFLHDISTTLLHTDASLLLHDVGTSLLHDGGASLLLHTTSLLLHDASASLLLHTGVVRTTLLLRRWVHSSSTSSTYSSLANPLPLSFPLPL
jgi:hypothetical protein